VAPLLAVDVGGDLGFLASAAARGIDGGDDLGFSELFIAPDSRVLAEFLLAPLYFLLASLYFLLAPHSRVCLLNFC
jgi:hypothetical protein